MLDGILVKLAVDGLEQEGANILLDQLVPEVFVETQICEVAAPLSVMLEVLRVLQHINHEVDRICRGYHRVAVQNFGNMGQTGGGIQTCLWVPCLLPQFHNRVDDVRFDTVIARFL